MALVVHGLCVGNLPWNKNQLQRFASWRITPKEVRVIAVRVLVKAGTRTGHESICYRNTTQKARSKGMQILLIKSQEHLQFILGEFPWHHPKLSSSGNAGATFLIRERIGIIHPGTSCRILSPRQMYKPVVSLDNEKVWEKGISCFLTSADMSPYQLTADY